MHTFYANEFPPGVLRYMFFYIKEVEVFRGPYKTRWQAFSRKCWHFNPINGKTSKNELIFWFNILTLYALNCHRLNMAHWE